jgi:hypothetical protein
MNYIIKYYKIVLFALLVISALSLIVYFYGLDFLQKFASILGSLSIVMALVTYFYNRRKDEMNSVIQQIAFFREKILLQEDKFADFIRSEFGKDYVFSKVRLDEPTIEYTNKNQREDVKRQLEIIRKLNTITAQTQLLNTLEEFALRVFNEGTVDNEALNALKSPYIGAVELNAVMLLQQREFFSGKQTYSNVLKLYASWKDDVDRRSPEERINEFNDRISR